MYWRFIESRYKNIVATPAESRNGMVCGVCVCVHRRQVPIMNDWVHSPDIVRMKPLPYSLKSDVIGPILPLTSFFILPRLKPKLRICRPLAMILAPCLTP